MRVVCWNIHGCVGTDRRFDPLRTARTLARLAPDVALLQEVGDHRGIHPPIDQAAALADALGMTCTLGITLPRHPYGYGNITLTRGAALEAGAWDLSVRGREPRVCLCVTVEVDRQRIVTANVHLGLGRRERRAQLEILLDEIGPFGGVPSSPTVVGGDFNDWPPGPVTRVLERTLRDAARASAAPGSPGKTFPSARPLLRLDRLYVGGGVEISACSVEDSRAAREASDHLPVVADLCLPDLP